MLELRDLAKEMVRAGLETFWAGNHFVIGLEDSGTLIDTPSSDSLHSLLYIKPSEIGREKVLAIEEYSEQLITEGGYLPAIQQVMGVDDYHTSFVWVHEQALLHAAASRHNLERAQNATIRILPLLEQGFYELADPSQSFAGAGNPIQLWSIGAYLYFERLKAELVIAQQLEGLHAEEKTDSMAGGAA